MKPDRVEECHCCESGIPPTPEIIYNRPGLSQVIYRAGTFASFRQSMIEAISKTPELRDWTARQSDDYGIALLEMWAYLADIITFYQERIANEAFLRTAVNRDTVIKLAAMLDYKLSPGAAAETYLSFTLGKDKQVKIPVGLKVQSVPGQDQKPQKFETVEAIQTESILNNVRVFPKPQLYNPFAENSAGGILTSNSKKISAGNSIVIFNPSGAELKEVTDLSTQDDQYILNWSPKIGSSKFKLFSTKVFPSGKTFHLFGYNVPGLFMEPSTDSGGEIVWNLKKAPDDYSFGLGTPASAELSLDAVYDDLKTNTNLLFVKNDADGSGMLTRLANIKEITSGSDKLGPLQDTVSKVSLDMKLTFTPVIILDHSNCIQVFTIGDDKALWTIKQSSPNNGWDDWVSLGGEIDMLAAAKNKDGRLEVFARGPDKALWHIWQTAPGGGWSDWASSGGVIDMIAASENADGRIEIFARGTDKALWHIWQKAPNDGWSGWASLGGIIDMLAVEKNKDGRIEVFARGTDKALWHIWQTAPNNGWSSWGRLGGIIDMLAIGKNKDGRMEVFVRGADKALWHIWQTAPNNGWSGWASLGGIMDMLAVEKNKDGRIEVFVRGTDKALWHIWQTAPNNGWSGWASLNGKMDMIAAGNNADGRIEIFVRGTDNALWHIWQTVPNNGWDGWYSLGVPMWKIPDIRKVLIYELTGTAVDFKDYYYPDTVSGNKLYIKLNEVENIDKNRVLIIDDKNINPEIAEVDSTEKVDTDGDYKNDHLAVSLKSSLTRSFDALSVQIFGNVLKAAHGETVSGEVLGSGDASKVFQEFTLKKSPVTFLSSSTSDAGVQNTLEVGIGGVKWKEVRSLYEQNPDDKVYCTNIDDEGKMTIRFGDGISGKRLPTGQNSVVANYRKGLGIEGNVPADSITTLLDRPIGLKSATNPVAAEGGTDPESLKDARKNAPNTVRTFERAISLQDYEDLARSYTGIAKAKAVKIFKNENEMIQLTIAGENSVMIGIGSLTYNNFIDYLNLHRDINHPLEVIPHDNEYLKIKAAINVDDSYSTESVVAGVKKAVLEFLSFNNLQLGQAVHLSDIYAVIQSVEGVTAVLIDYLDYKTSGSPSSNVHLRIEQDRIAALNKSDLQILSGLT